MDKSRLSVALGYLAVLLGYLCLSKRVRELVGSDDSIRGLVGSIRDFAAMYRVVDSKAHELELLVDDLRRHAQPR